MKMKALIFTFILLSSQAYAWGEREQSALLGFVGGVFISNVYHQNHAQSYYQPRERVIVKEVHHYHKARHHSHKQKKFIKKVHYHHYGKHHRNKRYYHHRNNYYSRNHR